MRPPWATVSLASMLLGACAAPATGPRPPDIVYGQDVCDACGMIISDARFAAGAALENGEALKFDDIGDMLGHMANDPNLPVAAWFVHDYPTETWLNAAAASYVIGPGLATPMGHGLAAFADPTEASSFAAEIGGEVLSWDEIRVRFAGP